jgi:hypothetical protein
MPVMANAASTANWRCTPCAIALTTSSDTAPCRSSSSGGDVERAALHDVVIGDDAADEHV